MHGFSLAKTFPFKTKDDARTAKVDANKFADSVNEYIEEFMRSKIDEWRSESGQRLKKTISVDAINAESDYIIRFNPMATKEFPFGLELSRKFTNKSSAEYFSDLVNGYIGDYIKSRISGELLADMNAKPKLNKTGRLLKSFSSVNLLDEHKNYGDELPSLREFGFAPSIATALIRWGENHSLVSTFEDGRGRTTGAYSWQPKFLKAAIEKHLEIFGQAGRADFPEQFENRINDIIRRQVRIELERQETKSDASYNEFPAPPA